MSNYTRSVLEAINSKDLKRMCVHDLGIVGVSKKTKDEVISAILGNQPTSAPAPVGAVKVSGSAAQKAAVASDTSKVEVGPITEMNFFSRSRLVKSSGRRSEKFTTKCYMACGANDGNFTVVGNTIKEALSTFGDILNANIKSTPLVNGEEVKQSYILKEDDVVEFLKPAGSKG